MNRKINIIFHVNVNCRVDGKKCNSNHWWNNSKCQCECKKTHVCEKKYVRNSGKCICENRKYLASIMLEPNILLFQ